jgi:small conductance mechanosensitive channel
MDTSFLTDIFINGIIAIGMGIAGYVVSMVVVQIVRPIARRFLEPGLANFVVSLARVAVLLLTLKLIVDQTGAAGVLVILATALTGAFALGSERIASDIVAGVNLLMLRYYRVGDRVTIGDQHGDITNISLTHTSLSNQNRDQIIIPNSEVLGQVIVNHTGVPGARLQADIPIEGAHDRDELVGMLLESANSFEPQLRGPNDAPSVILKEISWEDGSSVSTYSVLVIVPESHYGRDHTLLLHIMRLLDAWNHASQPAVLA